jgi:hypothetical protein
MGGSSNQYSDNPEDWGVQFADASSALKFYQAKKAANEATAASNANLRTATQGIRSVAQERPNFTGVQPAVAPSGMGGGSTWNEGAAGGGAGYATGLVPPGTGSPHLDIPVYDQQRVEALAQQVAAPGIRKLRNQVQATQGGVYDNPNVKAMTLRQALEGYGSGLESVMGGALGSGAAMYGQEYDPQVAAAHANYEGQLQTERLASQERQAALNRSFESWSKTGTMPGNQNSRGLPIPAAA